VTAYAGDPIDIASVLGETEELRARGVGSGADSCDRCARLAVLHAGWAGAPAGLPVRRHSRRRAGWPARDAAAGPQRRLAGRHRIFLLPCLNPTGCARNRRENVEGVDLNRDYREPRTAEVRAHIAWLRRRPRFDLSLLLHEDWEAHGFYVYELNPHGRPSLAQSIIRRLRRSVRSIHPRPLTAAGRHGSSPTWIPHRVRTGPKRFTW